MKGEIEKWEGKDGFDRYLAFLQESHRHYELSVTHVLRKNFPSLLSMLRPSFMRQVLALHPFESIYSRASRYFHTERLRRAFTFGSMYMGMSPFDAPGTYSLLQYTELAEGIWYPRGGFHAIVAALVRVGERLGVTYHLSTPIAAITITNNRATGITLPNGEHRTADVVISNADLVYTYNNLLPPSALGTSLSKRAASCSSISFYWSLSTTFPALTTHNIFLAPDYRDSFDAIFKSQQLPSDPSFYVNVPSRIDSTASPPGTDACVILVPCGHLLPSSTSQDWPTLVSRARSTVLSTIHARLGIDLAPHIQHEQIHTPQSWKSEFNLDKGAILGLSHSFFNVLSFRPRPKHARYDCLFFVGASTHPGTGVPICLAGAKLVSEQVLLHLGVPVPWGKRLDAGMQVKREGIDRIEVRGLVERWWVMGLVLVLMVVGLGLRSR